MYKKGVKAMLKIRDFARLAEVSMTTLRYYDEIGLLKPIRVDPDTAYRYYTIDQLPRLHRIMAFKELGLELSQISELLNEHLSPEALHGMLRFRQAQIQQRIQAEQEQLVRIEARLRALDHGSDSSAYEIVLKPVKSITGVSLRLAGPDLMQLAHWSDPLDMLLKRYGVTSIGHLIVLHPETEDEHSEPFVELVAPVQWSDANRVITGSEGRVSRIALPAFPHMASTIHHGHPGLLLSAYQALGNWMEQNGYSIVGPRRKIRLRREANLDDALTEIQFPVEKNADNAAI